MLDYLLPNVRGEFTQFKILQETRNAKTRVKRTDGSFINYCLATFVEK